ncbi:MAG: glycosyltransferase [Pseudomonadales bacterium]
MTSRRALLILENAGAGTGRHVIDLCDGLVRREWDVHVAYSSGRMETAFHDELQSISGVHTITVPMRREPGIWDVLAAFRLWRYVKRAGPFTLVHGHSSKGGALARIVGKIAGIPAFYTPHAFVTLDPTLSPRKRQLYEKAERMLGKLTKTIFCVSTDEYHHGQSIGIPDTRLATVPNGIRPLPAPCRAAVRAELGLMDHEVCIGFVGRLGHQKAVDQLLRAFAGIQQQVPIARLAIVGDGPESAGLHALSAELNLQDGAIWVGQADGARMMAGFDVLVLPSLYEGFPYVLLEAAARELPIVMTQVGGAEEMRTQAQARVVPVGDQPAMEQALLACVQDEDWRNAARLKARAASAYFSADRMVDEIVSEYDGCP